MEWEERDMLCAFVWLEAQALVTITLQGPKSQDVGHKTHCVSAVQGQCEIRDVTIVLHSHHSLLSKAWWPCSSKNSLPYATRGLKDQGGQHDKEAEHCAGFTDEQCHAHETQLCSIPEPFNNNNISWEDEVLWGTAATNISHIGEAIPEDSMEQADEDLLDKLQQEQESTEVNRRGFRNTDMDHYTTARFKGMKEEGKRDRRGLPDVKAVSRRGYTEGQAKSGNPEVMMKAEVESDK
ncbi:hypothetical protein K438DRAFT_2123417 [Mycena galopus ATCC 62051]|nr:hypothetical protein K438DRAFT_2123417 [Mycena galopus ATCC 62051]